MGRVQGGHSIPVTVGRIQDKHQPLLTTKTFRKIEIEMDIGRSSLLKLKRILQKEVPVESRVKEGLRSWDKLGDDQLDLHRINHFEQKIVGKKGRSAKLNSITRDAVVVKDVVQMIQFTIAERGLEEEETMVRISIDSGGGSLKILGSIFKKSEDSEIFFTKLEQPGSQQSGLNRVLLFGYVEDLQET